ncbi:hypothetical protein BW36_01463 [Micrococcus luteus]|nr:hypothetical protein BW36_01463 [Micrococcus luteus]
MLAAEALAVLSVEVLAAGDVDADEAAGDVDADEAAGDVDADEAAVVVDDADDADEGAGEEGSAPPPAHPARASAPTARAPNRGSREVVMARLYVRCDGCHEEAAGACVGAARCVVRTGRPLIRQRGGQPSGVSLSPRFQSSTGPRFSPSGP